MVLKALGGVLSAVANVMFLSLGLDVMAALSCFVVSAVVLGANLAAFLMVQRNRFYAVDFGTAVLKSDVVGLF